MIYAGHSGIESCADCIFGVCTLEDATVRWSAMGFPLSLARIRLLDSNKIVDNEVPLLAFSKTSRAKTDIVMAMNSGENQRIIESTKKPLSEFRRLQIVLSPITDIMSLTLPKTNRIC